MALGAEAVANFPRSEDPFALPAPLAVERLGRSLRSFPEGEPRRRYIHDRFLKAPTLPLVRVLACAQREAAMGAQEARVIFDAFGALMNTADFPSTFRERLEEGAERLQEFGLLGVINGARAEKLPADWVPRILPRGSLAEAGETLGRRKSLARTAVGDMLDRLIIDPHPEVIRNILLNPRLPEFSVVQLASKLATSEQILQVISESRFQQRPGIRLALAANPSCPPRLSCRLLPTLTRQELLAIAHDRRLADETRQAARTLIDAKPPRLTKL